MTAGIAPSTAIGSGSFEGSLTVTEETYAYVLPNLSPRHVPRPRLTRLLDDARGQTIVLHAPAGYGKTSLAVEWLQERDDVAWFTAQPESGDVGAAVLGVALAASRIVPRAADRVRQRLSVVEEPAKAARTFAEILAEDLADWPSGGIVAIDDYHHLAESDAAESFIDWLLVLRPSLRILVGTRRRPSWTSARRVLAGEIVELEKRALSMTNDEVSSVLKHDDHAGLQDLLDKAEGWPAVIGLAALSPASDLEAAPRIADDLFRYFAEEVLRSMSAEERRLMLVASVPRSVTPHLIRQLGNEEDVLRLDEFLGLGLLTEAANGALRFHPLVREFLLKQLRRDNEHELHRIARQLLEEARETERWEDAFDASLMLDDLGVSADVAGDSARDLIRCGRIETLERWLAACGDAASQSVSATLALATLRYFAGRFGVARSLALDAHRMAAGAGEDTAPALNLAARAASSYGLLDEALDLYLRARREARSPRDRFDATYGTVVTAAELEDPRVSDFAEELDQEIPPRGENRLRTFSSWTSVGDRMGTLLRAEKLLHTVHPIEDGDANPVAQSGAYSALAHVLCCQARFDEALETANRGVTYCERFHLPWAADWLELTSIRSLLGLGKYAEARSRLARLAPIAAKAEDASVRAVYERCRIQSSLAHRRIDPDQFDSSHGANQVPAALLAELRSFRALQAAFCGEPERARRLAGEAGSMTGAVEATCYAQLTLALAEDLEIGCTTPSPELQRAVWDAFERRLPEAFATVARHHAPLVTWGERHPALATALQRARLLTTSRLHADQGARAGLNRLGLTRRESEVLSFLAEGHSNAEIARTLVVSVSTVKTHVHHILRKLDVRNRAEAALVYVAHRDGEPFDLGR